MSSVAHDDHHHDEEGPHLPHGSLRSYVTGFVLSVILTAIPFAIVMGGGLSSPRWTAVIVLAFAVVQILVHMVYFLHMNPKTDAGWTMIALVFTIIVLVICVAGTIWVMYHMDTNMMPGMTEPLPAAVAPAG